MNRKKFSVSEIFEKESGKVGIPESRKVGKSKKSFSIKRDVIEDLEVLAWYMEKSSSQVVEEALKRYIANNKKMLDKAREIREDK
jgi:hypothetical protein